MDRARLEERGDNSFAQEREAPDERGIEGIVRGGATSESDAQRAMEKALGPDHSREGVFVYHNCWRCDDGKKPCPKGNPRNCENLHARND